MAGAIKGITVEIGGETTKLGKALGDVEKQTKSLQKELKGVETLLKMDPGNVTLLTQKQELLSKSIEQTESKLKTLKDTEDQVNEAFKKGEISEEQYRDFQREIVNTEGKLKSLTDQYREFGSVSAQQIAAAGENVKDFGGKVEAAGKAFMPVSAAAAAVGAASIASFNELDKGYDTIVRATGATGDALEGLKSTAKNVYGSMNVDMETVGGAVGEVNTRFGATGQSLEDLTTQFLQFSSITGQDVVSAVGNVDKIMEAWNIDASKTNEVLGLIAGKAQETGINVDTLENSVLSNNATFKEMGLTFEQSIALMAEFEANGVDAGTALGGLRKAVQNATKDGKSADEALKQTIDSIKNASSETDALSIASELFGKKGAAEMVHAIKEGRLSFDDLKASMSDYGDTVQTTYEATLDGPDKMQVAFNNLKIAGAELGEAFLTTLAPMIEKLADFAKSLAEKFENMPEPMKRMIVVITGIVAAIGPLLITGGKLIQGVGSIMTMAPKIASTFSSVGAILGGLSAPVLAIVAAIGVLVAAFVTLWNTNEDFRNKITEIWNNIVGIFQGFFDGIVERVNALGFNFQSFGEMLSALWTGLCNLLGPMFIEVFSQIQNIFQTVTDIILGVLDIFIGIFTGDWDRVWNGVKEIFGAAWEFIVTSFQNFWNMLYTYFGDAINSFVESWNNFWNGVKETASNIWTAITDFFTKSIPEFFNSVISWCADLLSSIVTWCTNMVNTAKEMGKNFIDGIINFFKELPGKIKEIVTNAFNTVKTWVTDMVNKAKEMGTNFLNTVIDGIKALPGKVKEVFTNVIGAAASWVSDMGNKGKEAIVSLINSFIDGAKNVVSKVAEIGRNIVSGVWNGIVAAKDKFIADVKNFFGGIVDGVKSFLGIASPSKVFRDVIGKQIPAGVAAGIRANMKSALDAADDMAEQLTDRNYNLGTFDAAVKSTFSPAGSASGGAVAFNDAGIIAALNNILNKLGGLQIVLDSGELVGGIIDPINDKLSVKYARAMRRG